MVTFNVDNVTPGKMPEMGKWFDSKKNLVNMVGIGMEASSVKDAVTFSSHNFLAAVNTAYDNHLPLTISPDMLWLVIAQGLSQHINNNAEELRHQFVSHEGKETIIVYENAFVKGSPDNDWQHCFAQFSSAIEKYIGKKRDLIVGNYTTTGPVEKAAHEIVLMEAMQKYFDYECHTLCGIPQVTLLGTTEDWTNILNRVRAMSEFSLGWWTQELEPIVQEFINASKGNVDKLFWQNIYKEDGGSGGPYLSGWIVNLFPYLKDRDGNFTAKNDFVKPKGYFSGPTTSSFPTGMSKVPFIWDYLGTRIDMELAAGFTGVAQDEFGSVSPQIGWAVRDAESMVMATATFDCDQYDYNKSDVLRKSYLQQLAAYGWEEKSGGWGNTMTGVLTKENYAAVQEIGGLTWTKK